MNIHKKVLIVSTIPATVKGFYLDVADMLKKNEVEVFFGFSKGFEAELVKGLGYKVKTLPMSRKPFSPGNVLSIFSLAIYLFRNKVDIIETTTPVASVVGRIAAVMARVPIRINTIRGLFPRDTHRYQATLFDLFEKILFHVTTLTITINGEDRARILSKGCRNPNSVIVLPCGGCGVDLNSFNRDSNMSDRIALLRAELDINTDDFVVAFIGRLARDKGIYDLIEIIEMLKDNLANFKILIVGEALRGEHDAVSSDHLRALLMEKGIEAYVVVTGLREDIPAIIAASDIVVLPSYREGFGLVLAEAAAMGKPTVAYANAGTRDAIDNGRTGILIERGDVVSMARAIEEIARDADSYNAMSESAFEKAKREFNIESIIDEYRQIYMGFFDG